MDGYRFEQVWRDAGNDDIPDSVEAFWDVVRDLNYTRPIEDGDICAVYRRSEDKPLDLVEDVYIGWYDGRTDAVKTAVRASYGHFDIDVVTAETTVFPYELEQIEEDGYRVAAVDSGPGWRSGHDKDPIDIENVPKEVMEQLKDHGTYWSRNGGDVLAVDRWDDRLMRFHRADEDDA